MKLYGDAIDASVDRAGDGTYIVRIDIEFSESPGSKATHNGIPVTFLNATHQDAEELGIIVLQRVGEAQALNREQGTTQPAEPYTNPMDSEFEDIEANLYYSTGAIAYLVSIDINYPHALKGYSQDGNPQIQFFLTTEQARIFGYRLLRMADRAEDLLTEENMVFAEEDELLRTGADLVAWRMARSARSAR